MAADRSYKDKRRLIEDVACDLFGVASPIEAIEFHAKDEIWYFPPEVHANLKEVYKFMDKTGLQLVGLVRSERGHGLAFRIVDAGKMDAASGKA